MVKVPGTEAGIPAIRALIGAGINVNVTLLFGLAAYESTVQAYLAGLEDRVAAGVGIAGIASVASIFVSRLDSAVEPHLDRSYAGKVAIANAKIVYAASRTLFSGTRWNALAQQGARNQRLLWASTSVKNPALPELLYVEALLGPDTVDTVPPATFEAFAAHGTVRPSLEVDVAGAHAVLDSLPGHGVELSEVLAQLVADGVEKFATAFRDLLSSVERALAGDADRQKPCRLRTSLPKDLADHVDGSIDRVALDRQGGPDLVQRRHGVDRQRRRGLVGLARGRAGPGSARPPLPGTDRTGTRGRFRPRGGARHGGSSLCPDVLAHSFAARKGLPRLLVLDSTDPAQVRAIEEGVDLSRTLFFVSSKSGSTLEPNIFAAYFYDRMTKAVGADEAGSHFIAITDPGSPLQGLAERQGYRAVFFGVPSIGGRYSALSDFGMAPGAACGVDVERLLSSAEKMAQCPFGARRPQPRAPARGGHRRLRERRT